jgi:hypothetical protein
MLNRKNICLVGLALALAACGGEESNDGGLQIDANNTAANANTGSNVAPNGATTCTADAECGEGSICDIEAGTCVTDMNVLPAWDATITEVYVPQNAAEAPDLEFHPDRDQLWVVNRRFEAEGVCSQSDPTSARCRSLAGFTTLIDAPGTADQSVQILEDGNSWHFMRRPPALAMGDNGNFATCGEAATGNFEDNPAQFIGPSLWSTDLSIYAQPSGGNGSHLDMLHATPWCMGIAHEVDNVYWTFNGEVGSLDRYDFNEDHGPGADDHSDGEIFRYVEGELSRVENVPSHMVLDKDTNWLYVADTGNARIVRLDVTSGDVGAQFQPVYEPLADWGTMLGATFESVVGEGLEAPSGIALGEGELLVSDNATGKVYAFDMQTWEPTRVLDTGLEPGELAGIEVGPNGALWFTNFNTGAVYKAE